MAQEKEAKALAEKNEERQRLRQLSVDQLVEKIMGLQDKISRRSLKRAISSPGVLAAIILAIGGIIAAIIAAIAQCDSCCPEPPSATPISTACSSLAYDFEGSTTEGWIPEEIAPDVLAITGATVSDNQYKCGTHSLELTVTNLADEYGYDKGEAYIEFGTPIDLTNQTITIRAYGSTGSSGDPKHLNGFHVFVKDLNWYGEYGCWYNIMPENTWKEIQLTVTELAQNCPGFYKEEGFNPAQISAIGIAVGAGTGSTKSYQGPIYIDAVSYTGGK